MLTKEDMKVINNRLQGTGTKQDEYLNMGFNTLNNSANGFLYEVPVIETYTPEYAEEIKMERPMYDIDTLVSNIVNKTYETKNKINIDIENERKIEDNKDLNIVVSKCGEEDNDELVIPYFVTPFYTECKLIAEQEGTTVDAVAYEKVAEQLGITVRRAVRLINEGLIELKF